MKLGSTLFLKIAIILIGAPALAVCAFGLPWLIGNPASPEYGSILYPIITIMFVSVIPFFGALHQAFQLLNYIDKNESFSNVSVISLKKIKYCAISVSVLYVVGIPFFYLLAEMDDAPGVLLICLIVIFASMVIAVFAAVLQRLLHVAIEIKAENDLIV